jgi:hypothetical protein
MSYRCFQRRHKLAFETAALATFFYLGKSSALDTVSKNPSAIVNRNREKLNPRFITLGILPIRMRKIANKKRCRYLALKMSIARGISCFYKYHWDCAKQNFI